MTRIYNLQDLDDLRAEIKKRPQGKAITIAVCNGTGCQAYGCGKVTQAFMDEVTKHGLDVEIKPTGCHGFCQSGPITVIHPDGIFYQRIKPEDVGEIISETIMRNRIIQRLLYEDPLTLEKITYEKDVPFYKKQMRIIFGNNGFINPRNIDDYIAIGGYSAISKVLKEMEPEEVIGEIKNSGLRGRGGAGFPTGVKWEVCRNAEEDQKYLICNSDEGDPGAYMDRSLLEGNPHSVIEGMLIGAYTIGAPKGFIYVRHEYPLAVKNISFAISQASEYGLLGKDILGPSFSFDIEIIRGAGAFICGEETSLIASIEGGRGEPRPRPPYPAQKGLWGKPTNINNVETWANIPLIIDRGADWYTQMGTEKSKGTKIFSLVGKINNTGLIEVPMGISLREVIYEIGGGIPGGKKFKAIQTGGPSGGCIPAAMLDLPIDYEGLTAAGSIMGSGGLVVMDEDTCMVDVAKYFLKFTVDESCGLCTPCREGIKQMLHLLTRITEGTGKEGDIELLEELCQAIKDASLCGLGGTAPNPVLSTLRYFPEEYQAHIKDKRCPAKVCRPLIRYQIDAEKCVICGLCIESCPEGAIASEAGESPTINLDKCIKCGICLDTCPSEAIIVQ